RPLRPRGVRSSTVPEQRCRHGLRRHRLSTPKAPAIRFARAMTFVASWFTHLLRPARLLAPRYGSDHLRGQRGLLLPGFQRDAPVAGYNYSSDWPPLLTGLSPARMAAASLHLLLHRVGLAPTTSYRAERWLGSASLGDKISAATTRIPKASPT